MKNVGLKVIDKLFVEKVIKEYSKYQKFKILEFCFEVYFMVIYYVGKVSCVFDVEVQQEWFCRVKYYFFVCSLNLKNDNCFSLLIGERFFVVK